jgi:hypothetical protein
LMGTELVVNIPFWCLYTAWFTYYWTTVFPWLDAPGTTSIIFNFDHRNTRYKLLRNHGWPSDTVRYLILARRVPCRSRNSIVQ